MLFSISSLCSLGLSRYPGCHYKYKYDLLLWQTAAAKGASGSAREGRPPLCCLFWSLWRPQGDAHMVSMVTQVSAWYWVVWQPASLSSLALAMLSFSQKIPSHSSLPATCSILLAMLLEGYWGLVRTMSEIRVGCGENMGFFLLPCVIFQLDQFPRLPHIHVVQAGMCQEGFSPVLAQDEVWRDAGMSRTSHAVEQDPSSPHLGPGGWSSLWWNGTQMPPTGSWLSHYVCD